MRIQPILFIGSLLGLTVSFGHAADPQAKAAEVRDLVAGHFDSKGPGVAVLVSRNGVPLHLSGYGLADVKSGTPITSDSVFNLASVSKHMSGVAILLLAEQGKLDLDAPLKDVLPDFTVPEKRRPVTISSTTSRDWPIIRVTSGKPATSRLRC